MLLEKESEMCTAEELSDRYTIANLVESFMSLDAKIADLKRQMDKLAGHLEMLRGALTLKMDANGLDNVRTPYGTPYFSTTESMRVIDRAPYFEWVIVNRAIDVLTSAVAKDAVRERRERGEVIPGLEIMPVRKLHVRKPA